MINRTHHSKFLKGPSKPARRMKSANRDAMGADMSEANTKSRRSFIAKPTKPNRGN